MDNEIISQISSEAGIVNKTLLEKDLYLHQLLLALSKEPYIKENLAFKGGTCLIKCYLGYYRFSEDPDFTWINQKEFDKKSQKEIRRMISQKTGRIISIIGQASQMIGLRFKPDKKDQKYVEYGGSNKLLTLKAWYFSETMKSEQFIKVQINFLEKIFYSFKEMKADSLMRKIDKKKFEFLFPEQKSLLEKPIMKCYDLKEIFIEKARAVITRKSIKARDFIDIYMMAKKKKLSLQSFKAQIIEKTGFMMRYDKYSQNLKSFRINKLIIGEEEKLMLQALNKNFHEFAEETNEYLASLAISLSTSAQKTRA